MIERAFARAFNARNIGALVTLLAPDARSELAGSGFPPEEGAGAIRGGSFEHLLEDEGLLVGATYPDPPPEETWVVQDQLPKPGESVTVGTKVDLMLADPQEPCPPG